MKNDSMKKIILWSIVSAVIAGIAVDAFLWLHKPQVILLKDGTRLTLAGVTYGRHHAPPKIKLAGTQTSGRIISYSFMTARRRPASAPGPAAAQAKSRPAFIFKASRSTPFRAGTGKSSCASAHGTTWVAECRKPRDSSSFQIPPASNPLPNGRRSRCRTPNPTAI
jgi:hypothetical protein